MDNGYFENFSYCRICRGIRLYERWWGFVCKHVHPWNKALDAQRLNILMITYSVTAFKWR